MSADFPQCWLRVLLNDVGEIVTGKTPSTKNPDNFGGSIPFIKPADLDNGGYVTRTADTLTDAGAKLVPTIPANSIPVTCIGNLGKVGITNQISATNQQINTIVPSSQVDYRFFYYQLQTLKPWMQENASATTVTIINKGKFSKAPVTLPPLAEQKVIADKLDTLLAQVENTKARLERIPQILKRFRQSVLAAAVSGRLTEEWRATQGTSLDSWQQTTFQKICREITVGFVGRMANRYEESGVPFLRSQNVRAFRYSDKNLLYISPAFHQEIYKSRLEPGDLAIVRSGAPGTTCVIPKSLGAANCSDLVIARPSSNLLPEFGCIFMNSEVARKNVSDNQVGVAQQHFNVGSMKKMPIHLPPVDEQSEIVRRVDQLFAHADRIEQQVNNALARVNNLTQSILAKAFRGELTEQWRKDNPELISGENSAEALLERIKAERAASKPAKKTRQKRTTA
ncbi:MULTISPECIES: restriction endonuclease subunit S [unclassified Halomonas]|uniref:restriction endonuclease subunit S n=1 Tax=unclassified Halomonas TaxID=2609666 RepID=UPI0018E1E799|nr:MULTISPECIES: restriction endonuclease subunit S [unclassified Halomonas]